MTIYDFFHPFWHPYIPGALWILELLWRYYFLVGTGVASAVLMWPGLAWNLVSRLNLAEKVPSQDLRRRDLLAMAMLLLGAWPWVYVLTLKDGREVIRQERERELKDLEDWDRKNF